MADQVRLLVERVTRRIQLLSLVSAILGIALMSVSAPIGAAGYHKIGTLVAESGAAIFISGVLATLWELGGKRAFADEILAKANMSRDLADAGIELVADSFKSERINWDQLFKNTCRLDIFVAYAHTWRNTQSERIDKLLSDEDAGLRVVLPDPDVEEVVNGLSGRFKMEPSVVKQEIGEAIKFFENRKKKAKGTVDIFLTQITPVFSFYRFTSKAVVALYNHREGQQQVPSFACDREGFLFRFLSVEFEGILGDTRTKARPANTEQAESERV